MVIMVIQVIVVIMAFIMVKLSFCSVGRGGGDDNGSNSTSAMPRSNNLSVAAE